MDTNLVQMAQEIAELRRIITRSVPVEAGGGNTVQIVGMLILALTGVISAIASWIAKQSTQESKEKIEVIKVSQAIQEEETKKIHVAVNSRDTASMQEIKDLNLKNGEMMKMLATLQEKISNLIADRDQTVRVPAAPAVAPTLIAMGAGMAPLPSSPTSPTAGAMADMVAKASDAGTGEEAALLKELLAEIKQYKTTANAPKGEGGAGAPALRTTK